MPTVHTLDELYELLGCAIADVMEHPSTPPRIYNELGEFVCNLVNRPRGVGLSGAQARSFMPECLKLFTAENSGGDSDEPEAA
jgi:hypothetical protein